MSEFNDDLAEQRLESNLHAGRTTIAKLKAQLEQAEASISGLCLTIDEQNKDYARMRAQFIGKLIQCAASHFENNDPEGGRAIINAVFFAEQETRS